MPVAGAKRSQRAAPMAPAERRRAIVDVVVPLLLEHGSDVTTRQIAEAAGIAEGTIFRVFPDKAALLMAAAEETMNPPEGQAELELALAGVPATREREGGRLAPRGARWQELRAGVLVGKTARRGAWMSQATDQGKTGGKHEHAPG